MLHWVKYIYQFSSASATTGSLADGWDDDEEDDFDPDVEMEDVEMAHRDRHMSRLP